MFALQGSGWGYPCLPAFACTHNPFPPALCLLSLKLECDKLASEKSEMQRHYVMVTAPGSPLLHPSSCCLESPAWASATGS